MGSKFAAHTLAPNVPTQADASHTGARLEHEADHAAARILKQTDPFASRASIVESLERQASRGQRFLGAQSTAPSAGARAGGQPLPEPLGTQIGAALGADLSSIRVHDGAQGHAVSTAHDAFAVTSGRNVFFAHGMYQPEESAGRALLAHELAHTVQQGAVPVVPGVESPGLSVGSARLAGPQRSGDSHKKPPTAPSNQIKQLVGGTAAATTYVTGTQPQCLRETAPTDPVRQEFGAMLDSMQGQGGDWTQYEREMMRGQNGAQTKLDQTMPPSTIPLFHAQLQEHQALDAANAPAVDHHRANVRHHQALSEEFWKHKYWSGGMLHQVGKKQAQLGAWVHDPQTAKDFEDFVKKGGGGE